MCQNEEDLEEEIVSSGGYVFCHVKRAEKIKANLRVPHLLIAIYRKFK